MDTKQHSLYAFCVACFRIPGFIWEATLQILSQPKLCGLFARPQLTKGHLTYEPTINPDDRRAYMVNGIHPSCISTETAEDVAYILAERLMHFTGDNVLLADVALAKVSSCYLVNSAFLHHTYKLLTEPLYPAIGLCVFELLHPNRKPIPSIISYPNETSPKAPNVYLKLWRHSYLQIPLSLNEHSRGVCGKYSDRDTPIWLHIFTYLFCIHGSSVATHWHQKYPGLQSPLFCASEHSVDDTTTIVNSLYDGWVWVLAITHWILLALAYAPDLDTQHRMKTWLRHHLIAIDVVRGKTYTHAMDVSRIALQPTVEWYRGLATIESLNVSTPTEFIAALQALKVINLAECNVYQQHVNYTINPHSVFKEEYLTTQKAWQKLLHLFDASVRAYIQSDQLFL